MPRKSNEELKTNINVVEKKKDLSEKLSDNKSSNSKSSKSSSSKSTSTKVSKTVSTKITTQKVKSDTDKEAKKSTTRKSTSTKTTKTADKKTKATSNKIAKKTPTKSAIVDVEYYDLPYRYNETVVKILAQTPTMLFIYWDISDADRNSYIEKYGEDFFYKTKPILIIHNKTRNYTFEVEINDFANSWYLHVNDTDCDYSVELGRRPIYYNSNIDDYVYISTSNDMETPNNRILFDKLGKSVFFKNIKNNFMEEREISSISFIKNIGKVYDIYELYAKMYKDEIDEESNSTLKLNLSSSSSSTFK